MREVEPGITRWNYRVVQSFDGMDYRIAEVYYHDDGDMSWASVDEGHLQWDDYDDLKGTVKHMLDAFNRPMLRVVAGDKLEEAG